MEEAIWGAFFRELVLPSSLCSFCIKNMSAASIDHTNDVHRKVWPTLHNLRGASDGQGGTERYFYTNDTIRKKSFLSTYVESLKEAWPAIKKRSNTFYQSSHSPHTNPHTDTVGEPDLRGVTWSSSRCWWGGVVYRAERCTWPQDVCLRARRVVFMLNGFDSLVILL